MLCSALCHPAPLSTILFCTEAQGYWKGEERRKEGGGEGKERSQGLFFFSSDPQNSSLILGCPNNRGVAAGETERERDADIGCSFLHQHGPNSRDARMKNKVFWPILV